MKNKKIRGFVNQIHLWLGLITGIIVFIISITGFIYVFEEEIRGFNQEHYLNVPKQEAPFIGLEKIIENFETQSKEKLGSVKLSTSIPNATVQVLTTKKKTYYFNPYNGNIVHIVKADWLNIVLELHTSLLMGETGKAIQGWAVVVFLMMLITGLILWFPNQRRLLKQSLKIKWKASFKRFNFDLHQVLGFYASVFLIIISLSGIYFAFDGAKKTVAFITGTKLRSGVKNTDTATHIIGTSAQKYNSIYQQLSTYLTGAESATFSVRKSGELRVRIIYPYQFSRKQNTFFFDEPSGELLRTKLYKDNTTADWYEALNYDLHTGRWLGYTSKIFWGFASLISASLPVTGFIIWWKKSRKLRARLIK